MSVCSKHQTKDPTCTACSVELYFDNSDTELVTCSGCNFVYYAHCDTCPKCQIENI